MGRTLSHLFDLHEEVLLFLSNVQSPPAQHMSNLQGWLICLTYSYASTRLIHSHYFSDETIQDEWIRNPFKFKAAESDALCTQDEEALIDLTSNHELEQMTTHHWPFLSLCSKLISWTHTKSTKETFTIRFNLSVWIRIFCYDFHQEQISFTSSSGGWPSSISDVTTTTK